MSSGAVQFYGIEAVLTAYENKRTPAFAVWCGKQMQIRYDGTESEEEDKTPTLEEGEQLLRAYLEAIYPGSSATYTLKTYDDLRPGEKIRPSTEYDTAFNFKITAPVEMGSYGPPSLRSSPLLEEIRGLRDKITALEAERVPTEEPDEPETLEEAAIGVLHNPEKLTAIVGNLRELFEMGRALFGVGGGYPPPVALGAVTRAGETAELSQAERFTSLEASLNALERADPDLVAHLAKLADIATTQPGQFKTFLTILDNF